jgi:hypothetical protein
MGGISVSRYDISRIFDHPLLLASLGNIFRDKTPLKQWFKKAKNVGSQGGEVVLRKVIGM